MCCVGWVTSQRLKAGRSLVRVKRLGQIIKTFVPFYKEASASYGYESSMSFKNIHL